MPKYPFAKPAHLVLDGLSLDYNQFATPLAKAQYAVGLLEGSQKKLHNAKLLISPLTAKEATVSSRIEGTYSTVSDVFLHEAGGETKYSDVIQVGNYRHAMTQAVREIEKGRPLSVHLAMSLHGTLLDGVRHRGTPGKFRDKAVWIAEKEGDLIEKAIYIPPEPHLVRAYMDNIVEYLEKGAEDALIRVGIMHYQFEAVHPFEDGNGRIGRLLIPLALHYKKKVSQPLIYMSGYFDAHRDEYIAALHEVDRTGKYERWLSFFLHSVAEQLRETQQIVEDIYSLYDRVRNLFGGVKSPYLVPLVDHIFKFPIFTVEMAKRSMSNPANLTVMRLIQEFKQKGILIELKERQGRRKLYAFQPLLDVLK